MTTHTSGQHVSNRRTSAPATGWTMFAAFLMIFGGALAIFQGAAAIARNGVFVTTNYSYEYSVRSWGWIHLILGIVVVLGGFALFRNALWARMLAVLLAGLSMVANFVWLPHYPLWSIILIAIDIIIIWAVCANPPQRRT
ncbi:hypothetical protein LO772_33970 [Yinghuangia sp. ASG 101]|uniref:DUF7144 family membrane protein n=1 Tax=Yinghuangia sp. ASG 101 TaxID=2896848 RepID=UPI001E3D7EA0|nr:hypothetical protein [Yinghuangia sp. ASG 101]UGQ11720.1 hypothetical protein LO772_33970 [Yinghuangia sp. ASG 101]